jgi:hypothetical protein
MLSVRTFEKSRWWAKIGEIATKGKVAHGDLKGGCIVAI